MLACAGHGLRQTSVRSLLEAVRILAVDPLGRFARFRRNLEE